MLLAAERVEFKIHSLIIYREKLPLISHEYVFTSYQFGM